MTEGNYLLVDDGDWARVRPLLDEAWYVEMDEDTRLRVADPAPHRVRQGAGRRARVGDAQRSGNAAVVAATRERADVVVRLATT